MINPVVAAWDSKKGIVAVRANGEIWWFSDRSQQWEKVADALPVDQSGDKADEHGRAAAAWQEIAKP